jgi:Peptidase family C25
VFTGTNPAESKSIAIQNQSFHYLQDTLVEEFFAFNPSNLPRPARLVQMETQDLHGLDTPDLIIITHPDFIEEANRLANFRRTHDHLDVEVATTQQVYNEFSSGSQDITAIRNFAMHLYYKTPEAKLKYLLLFGDCSFDFKNRIANNTNFVPTYESPQSLSIIGSYASDDYFGILAKNKGGWATNDFVDLGVGRLPAKNAGEAKSLVDKLIHYANSKDCLGEWRNRYSFVADNGNGCTHSNQADELSDSVISKNPASNVRKIYIGAYNRIAGAGGYTVPSATNELINTINKGNLIVNYTGHGGETVWADEFLFTSDMISQLTNYDHLAFFITATCDFGRHDYPSQTSGAESVLLSDKGGAIGIMTTGRPVGSYNNFQINKAFYNGLYKEIDGQPGRMGDAMREAKNINTDKISNRGFTLLGDPSASFAFPGKEVVITNLTNSDTIKGLNLVVLKGEVRKNGVREENFNGKVFATLYDRPGKLSIVDDDLCPGFDKTYSYQRSVLYNGSTTVTNGNYEFRFYVSKDISFLPGYGRITMYAMDENQQLDANGFKKDLVVGGLNPNPKVDNEGPRIQMFMNDTSFINYGLVGKDADLLVMLEDDSSGINVTGLGLGHDLTAILDKEQLFILNDYFENEEGSYTKGHLRFPLRDLSVGIHSIVVKAWDNSNNSNEAEIFFEVGISNVNGRIVKNVILLPNPSSEKFYLQMENSYAGQNVQIKLEIYNTLGEKITAKEWIYDNSIALLGSQKELAWDGTKSDGSRLPTGTYFCKIVLKSDTDGAEYKIDRKIILIR